MQLLIVIVNYRTATLAIDCLRSLATQVPALDGCHVCVVEGASDDGSAEQLSEAIIANGWSGWCSMHALAVNGGFAFGNNAGIRPYLDSDDKPEFVLLLNPDTIALPGSIATLLAYMHAHQEVGIAGSRTEDPDGTPQVSAFRFPTIAGEFEMAMRLGLVTKLLKNAVVAPPPPEREIDTDWVVGATMIVRRAVFEKVGLLDDRYFMYYEEVDFCLRARRAGFVCRHVPQARIVHLIGQASGVTAAENQNRRRPAYWFDSRRRYFTKNHGVVYAALADFAFIIGFTFWRLRRAIQRKPDPDPAHMLSDFVKHSVFVKREIGLSDYAESPKTAGVGILALLREDYAAHNRDWSRPGFRAMVVYRLGVWRMRCRSRVLRAPLSLLYRRAYFRMRNVYGIEIPFTAKLGRRVVIEHQSGIVIHGNSVIGDDCHIRQCCTLGNKTLERPYDAPQLGDRVNVGAGAKILGAITIGDDANIGANAVVVKDVPARATAVGIPAKILPAARERE